MAVKVHFVKDEIQNQTIQTKYVERNEQKADFLTKSSMKEKFKRDRTSLGMSQSKLSLLLCIMIFSGHLIETQLTNSPPG
jgi:hypothetical protein